MSSGFLRGAFAVALSLSLTACGSVGAINGVELDQTTESDRPLICGDYEWLCIGAGLAAFGGVVWALQENGNH
jgi:hypothetical protein